VQLFGRHWIILDSDSRVSSEVPRFSQGVVGQQPVLQPGAMFEVGTPPPSSPTLECIGCIVGVWSAASGTPESHV